MILRNVGDYCRSTRCIVREDLLTYLLHGVHSVPLLFLKQEVSTTFTIKCGHLCFDVGQKNLHLLTYSME